MLNLPLSKAAADPEFGTRGGGGRVRGEVWGGSLPLPRKICQILSKNDALLCKIFTNLRCIQSIGGGSPPPWTRHCSLLSFPKFLAVRKLLETKIYCQFFLLMQNMGLKISILGKFIKSKFWAPIFFSVGNYLSEFCWKFAACVGKLCKLPAPSTFSTPWRRWTSFDIQPHAMLLCLQLAVHSAPS